MERLEEIVAELADAEKVIIEAWGDEPTFRVRNKNFIFCSQDATSISFKLPKEETIAVVASDEKALECGCGLGRHGWVSLDLPNRSWKARWTEVREWIRTSYTMVAPKTLARVVLEEDGVSAE